MTSMMPEYPPYRTQRQLCYRCRPLYALPDADPFFMADCFNSDNPAPSPAGRLCTNRAKFFLMEVTLSLMVVKANSFTCQLTAQQEVNFPSRDWCLRAKYLAARYKNSRAAEAYFPINVFRNKARRRKSMGDVTRQQVAGLIGRSVCPATPAE